MSKRIDRETLVPLIAVRVSKRETMIAAIADATLEEIYEALKRGDCVSLENFGTFYVRPER